MRVYTRYLDYLAKLNDKTDQVIELGKNLLDISYYIKAGDIVNSVKAYGWYKSGWFLWETTNPISREAYNGESIKSTACASASLWWKGPIPRKTAF